ncbi:MAG: phosphoribosylaminoimidazole-succinocarboxamide synthase [Omnitrophica WOR_2 bacterium SM23_29]|nr:MAG: phosphoribosylaminoimidazole-succinocarboxamide synthase [Omnitrophica WOR_2 bacterium SM23_29]
MIKENILLTTESIRLRLFKRGKVRDIYEVDNILLIVATDRISCFDVVLPDGIPYKGKVLTQISKFWFDFTKDIIDNHVITFSLESFQEKLGDSLDILEGRSMLVKKAKPIAIECVVRGYLSGSGWKEYKDSGEVCGIKLPKGLKESDKLPELIFTPATKKDVGHDINVSECYVRKKVGDRIFDMVKSKSIAIYKKAADYGESKGIIIADTKFEFGITDEGKIILIDELLTPDSSRFWPKDKYKPGGPQPSFDKQFVRDYLEGLDWDKTPPAPNLPEEIINKTSQKYLEALRRLTGKELT